MSTRPRTCSNPTPVLTIVLLGIVVWLIVLCASAGLNGVALSILGGA